MYAVGGWHHGVASIENAARTAGVHRKIKHYRVLIPQERGDRKVYNDYDDGSYVFYVDLVGPEGVDP